MKVLTFLFIFCLSGFALAQGQSTHYKSNVNGLFTHGAITSSTHYKSKIVNTWTETHLQKSVHYQNRISIGTSLDSQSTSITLKHAKHISLSLYPNPAVQKLTVKSSKSIDEVQVFSVSGEQVFSYKPNSKLEFQVDLSTLSAGMYLVKVKVGDHSIIKRLNKL